MISLSLFTTKRYLRIDNLPLVIILSLYIAAGILFIFSLFNDLNIISVDTETIKSLDELDFTLELPEIQQNNQVLNSQISKKNNNFFLGFLNLFNNNNVCYSIDNELRNVYYINKHGITNYCNSLEWIDICNKYRYTLAHNKEVLLFIDCFTEILNDLELIESNLSKAKV
jgi:outer membrane protein assembly factor BamB